MADATYNEKMLAALRRERDGYVARDLTDRVQQVDKQIAALGGDVKDDAASKAPQGRKAPAKDDA